MRAVYANRRATLAEALTRSARDVELTGLAAGFHAVAHLSASAHEPAVIAAARARGVGLYGMSDYRSTGATDPPQLVLGFGNLTERAISEGIAMIGDLL
jgi:GntR family transcriptional regulator/MocR family aminotransferase